MDELQVPDPASGYTPEDFQKLSQVFEESGPWNTIVVRGRQYVVWAEPYSAGAFQPVRERCAAPKARRTPEDLSLTCGFSAGCSISGAGISTRTGLRQFRPST